MDLEMARSEIAPYLLRLDRSRRHQFKRFQRQFFQFTASGAAALAFPHEKRPGLFAVLHRARGRPMAGRTPDVLVKEKSYRPYYATPESAAVFWNRRLADGARSRRHLSIRAVLVACHPFDYSSLPYDCDPLQVMHACGGLTLRKGAPACGAVGFQQAK
jgi:hypothetical protein